MRINKLHISNKVFLLHSLFWISWIVSFTTIQSLGKDFQTGFTWLMYYIITLPIFIAHTYLIGYWLLPSYFFKNRFFGFVLWIFLLLVVFSVLELIISNELVFKIFSPEMQFGPGYLNIKNILVSGVGNHYIILIFLAIKAGKSWYTAKAEKENLLRQSLETEAEIFTHQFQPKIVLGLVEELELITEQATEKVPELIIRISEFMNHLLVDESPDMIPVSSELKLIDHYLLIQKNILGNRLKTDVAVSGNLDAWLIPPLSVTPFLNNVGRNALHTRNDFEVNVVVKAEKKYLLFSVTVWSENDFDFVNDNFSATMKNRMNFYFPGKHRIVENFDPNFREFAIEIYEKKM